MSHLERTGAPASQVKGLDSDLQCAVEYIKSLLTQRGPSGYCSNPTHLVGNSATFPSSANGGRPGVSRGPPCTSTDTFALPSCPPPPASPSPPAAAARAVQPAQAPRPARPARSRSWASTASSRP